MYISFWNNTIDSHAKVEKVVNAAKKPVNTKTFRLSDAMILLVYKPIKNPKNSEPKAFIASIAKGISKKTKFFRNVFDK
tara:strand:+ start:336 stop:572 length:237 start_codon:yes stop_codon:yes gene_type:complete